MAEWTYAGHNTSNNYFHVKEKAINIRHLRRVIPIYQNNQAILTTFFTISIMGFLVIYLEVSRLLMPDKVISARDLHHLTQGFANDIPWVHERPPPHIPHSRHKPSAIVIGFNHCGADHLLDLMALHPDVFVNRKDLRFFEGNNYTEKWYISHMPLTLPHQVTVDASLNYIANPVVLQSIKDFDDKIRIVIVICHPITRLFLRAISDSIKDVHIKYSDDIFLKLNLTYINKTIQEPTLLYRQTKNKTDAIISDQRTRSRRDVTDSKNTSSISNKLGFKNSSKHDISKNEANKTKSTKKIAPHPKSETFLHDEERKKIFDYKVLFQNKELISQVSRAYAIFPENQIHLVFMDELYSTRNHWSRLLNFLHVKVKDMPSKPLDNNEIIDMEISSKMKQQSDSALYNWSKSDTKLVYQQLKDFYTPFNEEVLNYLNKSS